MFALSVVSLFSASGPATIAGLIPLIIFAALKGQARRFLAHVGEKIFEGEPPLADCDPTSTVAVKGVKIWVETSNLHRLPTAIGRCFCMVVGVTMFHPCFYAGLEWHGDLLGGGTE
jgi:hypothetical protein